MKAKALFCKNWKEREEAEKLGVTAPDEIFETDTLYFKIKEVSLFLLNNEGSINIFIYGEKWILEWNQDTWDKLVKEFE